MSEENNTFENEEERMDGMPSGENYPYQNEASGNNYGSGKGQSTGLGIASMVCGILSILLICSSYIGMPILLYTVPVLGIVAIVLGIVQIVKNESKGMAIAGIVCGAIGLLIFIALICFAIWAITSGFLDNFMEQYEQILKNYQG